MTDRFRAAGLIASATFRNGLRGRVALLALASVVAVALLGTVFGNFSESRGLEMRLILELGLALSALLVLGTALLLSCRGIGLGEERHAVQALLSLPIPRQTVLLGNLMGTSLTLLLYSTVMATAMSCLTLWRFGEWRWALWVHFGSLFLEGVVVAAIATLLSLTGSSVISFFATLAICVAAHAESVIVQLAHDSKSIVLDVIIGTVTKFLPSFAGLDVKASAVRDLPIPWEQFGWAVGHALVYLVFIGLLAGRLFRRTEV